MPLLLAKIETRDGTSFETVVPDDFVRSNPRVNQLPSWLVDQVGDNVGVSTESPTLIRVGEPIAISISPTDNTMYDSVIPLATCKLARSLNSALTVPIVHSINADCQKPSEVERINDRASCNGKLKHVFRDQEREGDATSAAINGVI